MDVQLFLILVDSKMSRLLNITAGTSKAMKRPKKTRQHYVYPAHVACATPQRARAHNLLPTPSFRQIDVNVIVVGKRQRIVVAVAAVVAGVRSLSSRGPVVKRRLGLFAHNRQL